MRAILFVKDLDRMTKFYRRVLACEPVSAGLALHPIPPEIANGIDITSPPQVREETPIKLCLDVAELDYAALRELGIVLIPRPWGTIDCVDPEGNVFQLGTGNAA